MSPKELREFIHEIKSSVEGINSAWLVVDDSQLGADLEAKEKQENAYLIGVLPNYESKVRNGDSVKENIISQILVLEKVDYSELNNDEFVDVFERTYQLAKKVSEMLQDKLDGGCFGGGTMLLLEDLEIVPIWKKSQCNGWSINFSIE